MSFSFVLQNLNCTILTLLAQIKKKHPFVTHVQEKLKQCECCLNEIFEEYSQVLEEKEILKKKNIIQNGILTGYREGFIKTNSDFDYPLGINSASYRRNPKNRKAKKYMMREIFPLTSNISNFKDDSCYNQISGNSGCSDGTISINKIKYQLMSHLEEDFYDFFQKEVSYIENLFSRQISLYEKLIQCSKTKENFQKNHLKNIIDKGLKREKYYEEKIRFLKNENAEIRKNIWESETKIIKFQSKNNELLIQNNYLNQKNQILLKNIEEYRVRLSNFNKIMVAYDFKHRFFFLKKK